MENELDDIICSFIEEHEGEEGNTKKDEPIGFEKLLQKFGSFEKLLSYFGEKRHEIESFCVAQEYLVKKYSENLTNTKKKLEKMDETIRWIMSSTFGDSMYSQKIKLPSISVSFRESMAVDIYDKTQINAKFIVQKIVESIDKNSIKEELKKGTCVPGAQLEVRRNIQIK